MRKYSQKEMGGQAYLCYYLDKKKFQQAEKILEARAPGDEGSSFEEIIENQPYLEQSCEVIQRHLMIL